MPVENLEEEGLPKNPNLELAAWRFTITNPDGKDKEEAKKRLLDAIKENGNFHFVLSHVSARVRVGVYRIYYHLWRFLVTNLPLLNSANNNAD